MASLSLNERTFIARAAAEQQRVDGRRPFDPRKLSLRLGPSDGTAEVRVAVQGAARGGGCAACVQCTRVAVTRDTMRRCRCSLHAACVLVRATVAC
jgi:hypothetical protein